MSEMRDERRVVTALFADIVGSTALATKLDSEEAKLVVQEAVARCIRAVESYGGTIKDLAGDGVLALFGAPTAHEDDPERAVRAALDTAMAIRQYAGEVERGWGIGGFNVRIGIHTGEVVVGQVGAGSRIEYGAVGDPVNVASRLQSRAEPGEVLVSSQTRRLIAGLFDWSAPRVLELKGRQEAVEAFAVLAARATVAEEPQTPMLGREEDMARARRALDHLAAGRGGITFVVGDPGIGKSRLIAEMRRAATSDASCLWLEGRCVSYGESLPYWPFRDLLRRWLNVSPNDPELKVRLSLRRHLGEIAGDAGEALLPYVGMVLGLRADDSDVALRDLSPESLQYRTFEVLGEMLARLSANRPLVLVLDDLHWSDPTSLALTESLLSLTERERVLLVLSHRIETEHGCWKLRERAAREYRHLVTDLELRPLTESTELDLLRSLTGLPDVPLETAQALRRYAEGNPFYLEELVRSLNERRELNPGAAAAALADGGAPVLPETLEGVIIARLDRLQPAWRRVLTAASVLGRNFGDDLLGAVSGCEGDELRQSVHNLLRLELLAEEKRWPEPVFTMKHALIQEAVVRTLVRSERAALHRRAAEWYESHHAGNPERVAGLLAHHWGQADEPEQAATQLQLAADRAMDEWSLDEAITHYRELLQILEGLGRARELQDTLFKLGLALHTAMRFAEADEIYRRAVEGWSPPPGPPRTQSLTWSVPAMPAVVPPPVSNYWQDIQLGMQLHDRLVEAQGPRTVVPRLARSWEIAGDGLRYVFHLDPEAAWNDGRRIVAQDVVFGVRRILNPASPGPSAPIYFVLEGAEDYCLRGGPVESVGVLAPDEHTVEFRLVTPAPYFLNVLNRPDGGPQREDAILSGPWRVEHAGQDSLILGADPNNVRPRRGNVVRLAIRCDAPERAAELYAGGAVDLITADGPLDDYALIVDEPQIGAATATNYIVANCSTADGADVEFRRALAHAVDRNAIEAMLPPNYVIARGGIVPPALHGHTPDIAPAFDVAAARHALAHSSVRGVVGLGVPGGNPSSVSPPPIFTTTAGQRILKLLVEGWNEVLRPEVRIELQALRDAGRTRRTAEDPALVASGWLPGYPDPEYYLRLLLHSESHSNVGSFSDPQFDELIDRARRQTTGSARLQLFHEADRRAIRESCALIPLYYRRPAVFVKPWVEGWWEWGKSSSAVADLMVRRP